MAINKLLPLAILLAGSASATDWTPYLSSIKHNCNVEKIHSTLFTDTFANKKLPQVNPTTIISTHSLQ